MSRTNSFTGISRRPASTSRRLASLRAPATSREKPGSAASSASDIARLAPGRISPPTYLRKVVPCSFSAAPQRSIAIDRARRTRASSNGFLLVLNTTIRLESHGLSDVAILSPSASANSSRCFGVTPRTLGHDLAALIGLHHCGDRHELGVVAVEIGFAGLEVLVPAAAAPDLALHMLDKDK